MIRTIYWPDGVKKQINRMLVRSHDSINMQESIHACKTTGAYLNKTAAFLIPCLWNSVQKVKDSVYEQKMRLCFSPYSVTRLCSYFIYGNLQLISLRNNKHFCNQAFIFIYCHENNVGFFLVRFTQTMKIVAQKLELEMAFVTFILQTTDCIVFDLSMLGNLFFSLTALLAALSIILIEILRNSL